LAADYEALLTLVEGFLKRIALARKVAKSIAAQPTRVICSRSSSRFEVPCRLSPKGAPYICGNGASGPSGSGRHVLAKMSFSGTDCPR
jgi:hypothetical protein